MLDNLPPEILEQILGHLPTASAIVNLACTSRRIHNVIASNQYGVFRGFVQKAFPSIETPPIWREMACRLTSRSRAWDRRAFIARECYPLDDTARSRQSNSYAKFGYCPAIDCYEEFPSDSGSARREVLAFGAAGRLRLRSNDSGIVTWKSYRIADDHLPHNDIVDLKLLKPHQHDNSQGESLVICRANKSITRVETSGEQDDFVLSTQYVTSSNVDCMDVSSGIDPLLAVLDKSSLEIFSIFGASERTRAVSSTTFHTQFQWQNRRRCAKFLTNEKLATSVQFVQGLGVAPILVYDINRTGSTNTSLQPVHTIQASASRNGRHSAMVLANLDATASLTGIPGNVFLSGWTDSLIYLHDLRSPYGKAQSYSDPVDDGMIMSLCPVGHEKFFAGSHQNGCLKMFDLRMPGARPYSYLDAQQHQPLQRDPSPPSEEPEPQNHQRGINIFLAVHVNPRAQLWEPLPTVAEIQNMSIRNSSNNSNNHRPRRSNGHRFQQRRHQQQEFNRYKGSVYALSSPSPSSPTIYAGIENHVIQLDFLNTDDIRRHRDPTDFLTTSMQTLTIATTPTPTLTPTNPNNSNNQPSETSPIFNLSCYERPRPGREVTDPVLLRKQIDWDSNWNWNWTRARTNVNKDPNTSANANTNSNGDKSTINDTDVDDFQDSIEEKGWDERWRLGRTWKQRR